MVFLVPGTKIENWKICHRPISAVYMKILLFSVRKKSITENFGKRKLRPSSVSVMVQRIYSSWALSPMRFTPFFFVDCETYISFVLGEEDSSWGLRIDLCPTLVTRRKNIFLNSSWSSKLTISTISIKNITLSTLLILAVCRTRVIRTS